MSDAHDHLHHDHGHEHPPAQPAPEVADDSGSQALSEALRSSFAIIKVIMVGLLIVFLGSGFFTVGPQEKAVILRLGKPTSEDEKALLGPGAHWAFPYPIDEVVKIPIGQAQAVNSTVGWYFTTPAMEAAKQEPEPRDSLNPAADGYLLTADENIIHARATLRYRIAEPGLRYMFDFTATSNLVQNAFNNALVYAAARYNVDDILTRDSAGFRETIRARLEQLVAQQQLGIKVDQIDNLRVIPPRKLAGAFAAVSDAGVKSSTLVNQAKSYEAETVNKARAEAKARVNQGENERNRLVESIAAEAQRFTNNLPAWQRNRDLVARQYQTETLKRVLAGAQDKIILPDRANGKPLELRLQMSREPVKPKTVEQPKDEHR